MALPHAGSGEPIQVQPLGAQLAGAKTTALFKSADLELIRLVLRAGQTLPPHKVPGEITIHCIEGRIDVVLDGVSHVLAAGQLMLLAGNLMHAVTALEDASALVTIALKR